MKRSYLDYAMSVIVSRALPDVRDGLKPVHRRILYSIHEQGHTPDKKYRKSARVVGDVMGKYHPHGDPRDLRRAGAHGADFSMRLHAGRRAGQLRLGRRRSGRRPCATPSAGLAQAGEGAARRHRQGHGRVPAQLRRQRERARGAAGALSRTCWSTALAASRVGMATNIPPHNLGEVIDACVALIGNPAITTDEADPDRPGTGLPDRRHHPRPLRHLQCVSHRSRPVVIRGKQFAFETIRQGTRQSALELFSY